MRPEDQIVATCVSCEHAKETCRVSAPDALHLRKKARSASKKESALHVMYARCAGLDVHQKTVVVCVFLTDETGNVQKHVRTFSTMTADLLALDEWLRGFQVEPIALERTGVYWHPVYTLLEEGRPVLLVKPQQMKAVPGRKTDVKDAEWLADVLRHGLLNASFLPPQPIRE